MSEKTTSPSGSQRTRRPVHEKVAPGAELPKTTALALEVRKIEEIRELLWIPAGMAEEMVSARLVQALEFYQAIAPQDGLEGMLAMQMVGTHNAAMECLSRAALPNQTLEGRDMALKHAQKLMTLYTQQMTALTKHRGQGQQKVTIEHVHLHPDGQAIVGALGAPSLERHAMPLALEHDREMPVTLDQARELVPRTEQTRR